MQRCAEVTRGLLNFARHLNLSVQTINLKEIVDEVQSVLTKEAEFRSISVDVKVSENLPPFESDRGKLEQIFFNLFNNAIGNMNDGGHLEIIARHEEAKFISIAFCDNSRGIPQADLKHIFDPFFYSKTGEGRTGLGLSVTYALVQEIGGTISVESQLGKGTRFNIRIPLDVNPNNPNDSSAKRKTEL